MLEEVGERERGRHFRVGGKAIQRRIEEGKNDLLKEVVLVVIGERFQK